MNWTGTDIVNILKNNDKAIGRALLVLHDKQTMDEQAVHRSRHNNKRGFNKADAAKGTEHANFFRENNYLTEDMVRYWREAIRRTNGRPTFRIAIYWRQLLRQAYANHYNAQRQAA